MSKKSPSDHSNTITNWNTQPDGSVVQNNCRYYPSNDGTYEIEFVSSDESIGIVLETNRYGNYAIVKSISPESVDIIKKVVNIGDVLVAVNNHQMLNEEFPDIITFLEMLREGQLARRLRLLNPRKCPVAVYAERMELQSKSHKDMFGFLRSLEYLQKERQYKAFRVQIDAQRDIDWIEYLKSIGGADNLKPSGMMKASKTLKQLVRRGIPVAYRALIWPKLCLANRYKLKYPPNYYRELLKRKAELDPKVESDIDKDTDRTFPEHDYYGCGGGCEVLKRVLVAHALHNTTIGYCQSLNFVAGMMLLFMEEEEAFWMFITVLDTLLPHDYYSATMVGTYIDQFVFSHIIKTRLPNIHKVLESASLQIPLVTVQWFMCIFVNAVPPETALRCWDMFLNEGPKVLFRFAIGLFKLHEKQLLAAKDPGEVYTVLKGMGRNVIDADALIACAYRSYKSPEKVSNLIYASAKLGVGIHSTGNNSRGSASTPGKAGAQPGRYSSWIASQVPDLLVGIGLAHHGPSNGHNEQKKVTYQPPTSAILNIFGHRSRVLIDFVSGTTAKTNETESVSTPGKLATSVLQFGKIRDYRSFSKLDIEKWRAQFRPEVEERFNAMERARQKWKEKESVRESAKEKKVDAAPAIAQLTAGNLAIRNHIVDKTELTRMTSGGGVSGMKTESLDGVIQDEDDDDEFAMSTILASNLDMFKSKGDKSGKKSKESHGYVLDTENEPEIWPDNDEVNTSINQLYSSDEEENDYQRDAVEAIVTPLRQHSIRALDALNKGITDVDLDHFVSPLGEMIAGRSGEYPSRGDNRAYEKDDLDLITSYSTSIPRADNKQKNALSVDVGSPAPKNNRQHRRLNGK